MDRNALDWIFSTLPQTLAALSGLIFAGVSFIITHIETREVNDDSLVEIMDKMKSNIHTSLSRLFWLCCFAIIVDIVIIFLNPLNDGWIFSFDGTWDWYYFLTILLFAVNVYALIYATKFVLSIANPNYMTNAVETLLREYNIQKDSSSEQDGTKYLRNYQEFENGLREKVNNETNEYFKNKNMPMSQLFFFLLKQNVIDNNTYKNLKRINSIRNLLVHGSIDKKVPEDAYNMLTKYSNDFKKWPKVNW